MAAAYNQTTAVLNRWTGEGTSNSMPRAIWGDPNQNCRVSDRFVENGSYLRLKNITLSYTLPKKWMQKIQLELSLIHISDFSFWGNKQQEQGVTMMTPVKAIKGEEPIITQREKEMCIRDRY